MKILKYILIILNAMMTALCVGGAIVHLIKGNPATTALFATIAMSCCVVALLIYRELNSNRGWGEPW